MPILNNPIDIRYNGKTHSQLVVSQGDAPAEKWLPSDATNADVKFTYAFGPEYNSEVVIAKGKVVAAASVEYDSVTEKLVPRIKISNGTDIPMGINHHNVYQTKRDRFSGNAPTILTREYIRLPLFADNTDRTSAKIKAAGIKFGAMWVDVDETDKKAIADAVYGKYVVSDSNGNLTLPETSLADSISKGLVVGQVLGVELDMPPAGYLEYFTEMNEGELAALIKQSREIPSPGRVAGSDLAIDTFPTGTAYLKSPEDLAYVLKDFKQGIPFLTDGYFKARANKTISALYTDATMNTEVVDIRTMGSVSFVGAGATKDGNITVTANDAAVFVKLKNKLANTKLTDGVVVTDRPELDGFEDQMSVKVDGTAVDFEVDYYNNMIVFYPGIVTDKAVEIKVTVLENQIPGVPTGWDFPGVFGEVRILLQR